MRHAACIAILVVACSSPKAESPRAGAPAAPSPAAPARGARHVLPNGLVHVTLVGFDEVVAQDVDVDVAVARRASVEQRYESTYREPGHERWFFHAFDASTLELVVARWEPHSPVGGRYVAVARMRVARTPAAEQALGVSETIAQYESGSSGVRAGMLPEAVERAKGKPAEVQELGPFGSFDWIYPDACVRFLSGQVAHVWERSACVR